MKEFGLYDLKNYEQCVCIGTMKDIARYLNRGTNTLWSHIARKKRGQVNYISQRYDLVEIKGKKNEQTRNKKINDK